MMCSILFKVYQICTFFSEERNKKDQQTEDDHESNKQGWGKSLANEG